MSQYVQVTSRGTGFSTKVTDGKGQKLDDVNVIRIREINLASTEPIMVDLILADGSVVERELDTLYVSGFAEGQPIGEDVNTGDEGVLQDSSGESVQDERDNSGVQEEGKPKRKRSR